MAHAHGVHFEETLTGFKWLGNRAHAMASDYNVIFAYEEALGYMFPSISYDKDGIAAAALFLNAVQYWKSDGHIAGHMTPYEKLEFLYQKYGYHESINTYFISPNPNYTREFFDAIRMCKETVNMEIRSFKILRWRDVTNGIEQPMAPHPNAFTTTLPMDRNSQMLTFHMQHIPGKGEAGDSAADLVTMTVRASGTEPKVKLYIECRSESQNVAQSLAGKAFEAVFCMWMLEYGKEMKPARPKIKSSSGIMHDIYADFA